MHLLIFLILGMALAVGNAGAQSHPDKSKPVKIILPQGPGSASDVQARAFAKAITDTSGLTTVVDYKRGAETLIGAQAVLNAPADGYTTLMVSSSTSVLNPVMMPNLQYDPFRDFVPLVGSCTVLRRSRATRPRNPWQPIKIRPGIARSCPTKCCCFATRRSP